MNKIKEFLLKFWEDNKEKIFEAVKAAVRSIIFLSLAWLMSYVDSQPDNQTTIIAFSALTYIDKWLHENWKENKKKGISGIVPF